MRLKKGGKADQEFPDLFFSGIRMDRFHLYYLLFRIVIGRIKIAGHMELIAMGVLVHTIVLAEPVDQLECFFLTGNRYFF